jgi:hypothetical protein
VVDAFVTHIDPNGICVEKNALGIAVGVFDTL